MATACAALAALLAAVTIPPLQAAPKPPVEPFEMAASPALSTPIDRLVEGALRQRGFQPAHLCSDAVFVRRVYLDVIGTLPEPEAAAEFIASKRPDKRAALIDNLLAREEFAEYWALKWCDLLRVKAEFPINLWPNAVQAYHRWIRDALRANMPYDQFARELLTASGSNFRMPPVNFYRGIQGREPPAIAAAVALTFMGSRFESWPADRRAAFEKLFSRVAFKATAEWKEEIVCLDPTPTGDLETRLPDGTPVRIPAGQDPRWWFADWLIRPGNPWFARNIVNRQWSWLLGRGIIHEPDDIRDDNPPAIPELLAYLEGELARAKYDLRQIFRLILKSRVYQQSSIPQSDRPEAAALFACYPVRRLEAEVLADALCWFSGTQEEYSSMIPEPFTFIPGSQRSISLADGSITSSFLEMFGRPPRDTGLESERNNQPTDAQRLHLLNSSHVQDKILKSDRLRRLQSQAKGDAIASIDGVYLLLLSRPPTARERDAARSYFGAGKANPQEGVQDLAWALINSKEFLYRH